MEKNQLIDLKEQIDSAKQQVNQLEGRKEYLMQQLKEQWGSDSVESAKKTLKKMEKEISDLGKEIEEGTGKLSEKYDFN